MAQVVVGCSLGLRFSGMTGAMLRRCGDPQTRFRCVIVAGTNGKGTVASVLAALMQAGGQRVGLYTSPHLHSQRERIQVDGALLDKDRWAANLTTFADKHAKAVGLAQV